MRCDYHRSERNLRTRGAESALASETHGPCAEGSLWQQWSRPEWRQPVDTYASGSFTGNNLWRLSSLPPGTEAERRASPYCASSLYHRRRGRSRGYTESAECPHRRRSNTSTGQAISSLNGAARSATGRSWRQQTGGFVAVAAAGGCATTGDLASADNALRPHTTSWRRHASGRAAWQRTAWYARSWTILSYRV